MSAVFVVVKKVSYRGGYGGVGKPFFKKLFRGQEDVEEVEGVFPCLNKTVSAHNARGKGGRGERLGSVFDHLFRELWVGVPHKASVSATGSCFGSILRLLKGYAVLCK